MHPIILKLKGIAKELKARNIDKAIIKVIIKEELQNHILNAIYHDSTTKELIFTGGTALRKLYKLDRFSEDLDFNNTRTINLKSVGKIVSDYFRSINFNYVDYSIQQGKLLNRITFKFAILKLIELSPMDMEKLHVKVEICKTKKTYHTDLSPLQIDSLSLVIKHYSLPVMMSGKILACLERIWRKGTTPIKIKGRDYYDLVWYMQQKIVPDKRKLTETNSDMTIEKAFMRLDKKVKKISSNDLLADLQTYHADPVFIRDWCDNFHEFYARYRKSYP